MYLQLFLMGRREGGGREERRVKGKKIKLDAVLRAGLDSGTSFCFSRTVPGVLLSPDLSQSCLIEVLNPIAVLLSESVEHSFFLVIH